MTTVRPNLLMIAYFYPPMATGVRRVVSLARHLPDWGWNPMVLACRAARGAGFDKGPLEDERLSRVPVVRCESLDPYRLMERFGRAESGAVQSGGGVVRSSSPLRVAMDLMRSHFLVPDDRVLWVPFAVARGLDLVRRHPIRALYSTNYPQSAHVVAWLIARRTGLPWLADFRDGWTQNPAFHRPGNALAAWGQKRLERAVARSADRIVTVSPPITRHLQGLRAAHRAPVETVYNGFEPEEWEAVAARTAREPIAPGKVTLLYAGTFFGGRRPDLFLASLARVLRRAPYWREKLYVRLRCALDDRDRGLIGRYGLEDVVEVLGPVPHARILEEEYRSDACLLVLERGPGSEIMVSQKVFEYLAARRPIFAFVPEGAAAEVLARSGGATVYTGRDPDEAARVLESSLAQVDSGTHTLPDGATILEFDRRAQAEVIAGFFEAMFERKSDLRSALRMT